jgi:hypothetical protein
VPEVSRFFGIVISIFHREHGRPHFHAAYGEFEAVIDIENGKVLSGRLPTRALALVIEWHAGHRRELQEDWERAQQHMKLQKIAPLE